MHKVLIIDDEKDICFLISEILKDENYNTSIALNSEEAINKFNEIKPDLVILDVWLSNSKLDGIEILKEFKSINVNIPIIIISGHGTVDLAVKSIKNGAYDFLEKPFNSDKLIILTRRAIESSSLLSENKNLKDTYMSGPRHPEKVKNNSNPIPKKPSWIRVKAPTSKFFKETNKLLKDKKIVTVCEEAACPNIAECWQKKHATFMILGDICTRACAFCNIKTGKPHYIDHGEAKRIAESVKQLNLEHVVITSVDRDDLIDGGALHFINVIDSIKSLNPSCTIEILTPDFKNKPEAIDILSKNLPDVFNHNLETVPRLYPSIRPGSRYFVSLNLLSQIKEKNPSIFTKSGLMVGLGETKEEVYQVMDDLRAANVDFITIGQYLPPTPKHAKLEKFITPQEFDEYKKMAYAKGFLMVASSPLTRSSYHASDDFKIMQENRKNKLYSIQ